MGLCIDLNQRNVIKCSFNGEELIIKLHHKYKLAGLVFEGGKNIRIERVKSEEVDSLKKENLNIKKENYVAIN